ncbi:hypothetical protein VUR80DRAFT_10230 [Thermomyces stellatus]
MKECQSAAAGRGRVSNTPEPEQDTQEHANLCSASFRRQGMRVDCHTSFRFPYAGLSVQRSRLDFIGPAQVAVWRGRCGRLTRESPDRN